MTHIVERVRPEIEAAIKATVEEVMTDYPVSACRVEAKLDHADEEAIFIDVYHDLVDRPYDVQIDSVLGRKLDACLFALGEHRFTYVVQHFPDGQKVKGFDGS